MISILTPTRNRPVELQRMVESAIDTATGEIEFLFRMDSCDRTEHALGPQRLKSGKLARLFTLNGPRERVMCHKWNQLIPHAKGDIFLCGNDDCEFRTPGWDAMVEAEFAKHEDRILLVGGDDGFTHGRAIPHPFVSRRWIEVQGFFAAPYFESDYGCDSWNEHIAKMIGRRVYLPDLLIFHHHPAFNAGPKDATYLERIERHKQQNPALIYMQKLPERIAISEKFRALMGEKWEPNSSALCAAVQKAPKEPSDAKIVGEELTGSMGIT